MFTNYTILAIETSTEYCSVALLDNNHILEHTKPVKEKASLHVLDMIHNLLSQCNTNFSKLNAIAFDQGPGTFTGVRLGAAIAQSIAFAHNLPVIAVSSLACLAKVAHISFSKTAIFSVQDARMGAIYWGAYKIEEDNHLKIVISDRLEKPSEIFIPKNILSEKIEWTAVGSGWDSYSNTLEIQFSPYLRNWFPNCYPTAKALITLAISKLEKGEILTPEQALPIYLREAV